MRAALLLPIVLAAMAALPALAAPPGGEPSDTMRRLPAPVVPPGYAASSAPG